MFRFVVWRSLLAIAAAIALVAWLGLPYLDGILTTWSRVYAEREARVAVEEAAADLTAALQSGDRTAVDSRLDSLVTANGFAAAIACDVRLAGATVSAAQLTRLECGDPADEPAVSASRMVSDGGRPLLLTSVAVHVPGWPPAHVLVAQRLSAAATGSLRRFVFAALALATVVLALLLALLAWSLLRYWVALLLRDIRSGHLLNEMRSPTFSLPILSQVRKALHEREVSQRLEIEYRENWTPQALRQIVTDHLQSEQIIVVSNREPYSHLRARDGSIRVQLPASGMVTALEPVMRACSGVWVAHGSGSADRDTVDRHDRVRVPPGDPVYTLRRVWLTPEEEQGYYYGFANEGLWPLCHLAYVRPAFRASDWETYRSVNARFAAVVAEEAHSRTPLVLIQDFHFALLPSLVRERLPGATVALFWHVPWPNSETFGVCPWKRDILAHMLAADIVGFHTRYDCQNFLATCDRFIECQINHEHMTVTLQGRVCHVAPYPISIDWPPRWLAHAPSIAAARESVRKAHGLPADIRLGIGVERWDFTKGIVERFHALELFFEQNPQQRGRMSFLQVAAPSRSTLPAYRELQQRTIAEAERVNARFATGNWQPIVLVAAHQEPEQVFELYRAADFCLVNSLHDGMNLVAKEFVAARDDEDGVLVLSTFAGASRELVEALQVNPFDVTETSAAIATALAMPESERRLRMRLMRRTVQENNVYRWAGRMLNDAARIRQRQTLKIAAST